jgi:hypothetical protein
MGVVAPEAGTPGPYRWALLSTDASSNPYIKRPMNSFMVWSKMERPRLAKQRPDLQNAEISGLLGERWAQMSPHSKKPFVDQARLLKEQHAQIFPTYRYEAPFILSDQ